METIDTSQWLKRLAHALDQIGCKTDDEKASFDQAARAVQDLLRKTMGTKRSMFWIGNGGSCSICSHLSQDVVNKLGVRSLFLNDPSLITCMANDFGYENVYARPLKTFAEKGDLLIAISSSGNSDNIINALAAAREIGMDIITLSGFKPENRLWESSARVSFLVPGDLYGIVETGHETILHGIIETLWLETRSRGNHP